MKSKKRRQNDKRVNIILVCIILVLLALLIVVVATKTNKGQMKEKVPNRSFTFEKYTGKWYQSDENKDVYLNVTTINNALMHFDFKSGIEFIGQETSLNNGESTMVMSNGSDTIKVNIKVLEDTIELTVLKSDSQYFTDGETYTFIIK